MSLSFIYKKTEGKKKEKKKEVIAFIHQYHSHEKASNSVISMLFHKLWSHC
jgi:hypothetical protein